MSKLIVEICKVTKVEKHPNADKLDIVTVKGWNCIVSKDNHKVGDLVIYCPPDSVIPTNIIDQYNLEFLKKNGRVGTIKLRKYISQGLILNLACLFGKTGIYVREGVDVAKALGITKYEPPVSVAFSGNLPSKKKRNPLFDKYTEIDNIKNYNTIFKEGDSVVITEKIHGTNFRAGYLPIHFGYTFMDKIKYLWNKYIIKRDYEFVYGSHNVQLIGSNKKKNFYGEDVYGKIAKKYWLAEMIPKDYIIYGEIYGKGIQELEYGLKDIDVRFFDVKYKGEYLDYTHFLDFCDTYNLPRVPLLYCGEFSEEKLKECTKGNSTIASWHMREGCVVKSATEEKHPRIGRKILKSVNPEYLLKKNRTEFH
jgi:RNA ligase (TIGR02306 family)